MHRAALLAALALAACTAEDPAPSPSPSASPSPSLPPDEPLLLAAYGRNDELIRLYGSSLGALPPARRTLVPALRAHLLEHQRELRTRLVTLPSPLPGVARPVTPAAVIAAVRRISREDVAAAGRAADPANALLLAEIGASRAQHAVILGRTR